MLGYEDGRNVFVDVRAAGVTESELGRAVARLLRSKVDVIVTAGSSSATWAAKGATTRTPIVMAISEDAVESGLVTSMARPGGNITGISTPFAELAPKQLQILRDAAPRVTNVGVLATRENRSHEAAIQQLYRIADVHAVRIHVVKASGALRSLSPSLLQLAEARVEGILVLPDPRLLRAGEVAMFGLNRRIPTISTFSEFASGAGLLAYGPSTGALLAGAARYVDRILRGARPADLPVEQPLEYRLVINMTTARALGITIPPSLLARADQVIE
jgi:putative ABC transport system substrate-binding protein